MDYLSDDEEIKNLDLRQTNTMAAGVTTATGVLLNAVTQGFGATQRVGRQLYTCTVEWMWKGSLPAAATGSSPIQMMLIVDRQPKSAVIAATDIFDTDEMGSMLNLDNEGRFEIAESVTLECINQSTGSWYQTGVLELDEQIKMSGAGGAVANCPEWALYLLVYSLGTWSVAPTDTLITRLNFTDA